MAPPGAGGWMLSPDPLLKDTLDLWSSRALAAGQQLGVFAELGRGPRTALRLAERLGLAHDAARDLLDALLALGWLQREGDDAQAVYVGTRAGSHFLDPRSTDFLGDLLLAARAPWAGPGDAALDDALRAPSPAWPSSAACPARAATPPAQTAWHSAGVLMRQRLGSLYGQALAQQMAATGAPGPVLDLHGEGARLACAWAAQAGPAHPVTSLQPPAGVAPALAHVQAGGLAAQVRVLPMARPSQALQALHPLHALHDRPDPYALHARHATAVLSLLLEPGDAAWRQAQLQLGAHALRPGGRLLVLDYLADAARRHHVPALVFGLAGRMTRQGRGTLTEAQLRQACRDCRLRDGDCLPLPGGASVLVAHRPG